MGRKKPRRRRAKVTITWRERVQGAVRRVWAGIVRFASWLIDFLIPISGSLRDELKHPDHRAIAAKILSTLLSGGIGVTAVLKDPTYGVPVFLMVLAVIDGVFIYFTRKRCGYDPRLGPTPAPQANQPTFEVIGSPTPAAPASAGPSVPPPWEAPL